MPTVNAAAIAFVVLTFVAVAFQGALVLGAPWGEFTLGGHYRGALPGRMRIVPAVSLALLVAFAVVVLARAALAFEGWAAPARTLIWVVVGYSGLGVLANAVTPSRRERRLWLPVVGGMLVTSLTVALA